jgi:hypothetical protein
MFPVGGEEMFSTSWKSSRKATESSFWKPSGAGVRSSPISGSCIGGLPMVAANVPVDSPGRAGRSSSGSSRGTAAPAVIATSTSTGGLKAPPEGATLAKPFKSLVTVLWLTLRIRGSDGKSRPCRGRNSPTGRSTLVRKATPAAMTEFGGPLDLDVGSEENYLETDSE